MIAPVTMTDAGFSLLFHIADFAAGCHFAIFADHASACEGREAEKPNETHDSLISLTEEQFLYR
jgi:hypothetical protein